MTITKSLMMFSALTLLASSAAFAQVDNRLERQDDHIQRQEAEGKITPGQANRDENRDARQDARVQNERAANGGHLDKKERREERQKAKHDRKEDRHQERKDHREENH